MSGLLFLKEIDYVIYWTIQTTEVSCIEQMIMYGNRHNNH